MWGWSLISLVGRSGTCLHSLMLWCRWCHPSWNAPPHSAHVCFQSGLSQVCFWCWSGFSRTPKVTEKASCWLQPSWAVYLLLLCFTLCVFSQIYFVASLETCIKYTEMGKNLCEKRRKGFRFGSCVCHCPLLGSALLLSRMLDLLRSHTNCCWILGCLTRSLLLWFPISELPWSQWGAWPAPRGFHGGRRSGLALASSPLPYFPQLWDCLVQHGVP